VCTVELVHILREHVLFVPLAVVPQILTQHIQAVNLVRRLQEDGKGSFVLGRGNVGDPEILLGVEAHGFALSLGEP
jgi:hypothetical protein